MAVCTGRGSVGRLGGHGGGARTALTFALTAALFAALAPWARGGTVNFVVAEREGVAEHHDSFVLPLSADADITHARDLIARGPDSAGSPIAFAEVVAGSDGVNRNTLAPGEPLWHWHVSRFESFGDFGIELVDGNPTFLESDVPGWIQNTNRGSGSVGHIGFWNYTIVAELTGAPVTVPLPAGVATGALGLAAVVIANLRPWAAWRRVR